MAGEFCKGFVAWAGVVVAWDVGVVALAGGLTPHVDLVELSISARFRHDDLACWC